MGGAFVARVDDSSAGLWNPAGLAQLKQTEIIATYSALYTGLGEDHLGRSYLGYALPVHPSGTLGLNLIRLQSPLYSETTILFSYSHRIRGLYLGGNLKGLFANFAENEYTQIDPLFQTYGRLTKDLSFDLGLLFNLNDAFSLGVVAQNLNQPNLALEEGAESILPREIKAGVSFKFRQVHPSLDFTWRNASIREGRDINAHFGLETWLARDVGLRTGINLYELAAGASYRFHKSGGALQVDYAFNYPMPFEIDLFDRGQTSLSGTSGSHQFSLSVRFSDFLELIGTKGSAKVQAGERQPETRDVIAESSVGALSHEEIEDAIVAYQRILEGDATNIDAHFRLAQLYAQRRQYNDAIGHLARAVRLAPNEPKYHYALALLYEQYGDLMGRKTWYNKAFIEFQKTRMLDADYKDVASKIEAMSKK